MADLPNQPQSPSTPDVISYQVTSPRRPAWSRSVSLMRRRARHLFTRQQFAASLRSLAWVAPLTVLIWIYAEREQVAEYKGHTFPVEVKTSDTRSIVTLLSPSDGLITAD